MAKTKVTLGGELMFPSDFLSAVEFKGRDVTLTIKVVQKEDLQIKGGKKERKPVIYFDETPKKLVCNPTNGDSIAQLYGNEAKAWAGKRVTLYPTKTMFGRETVDCIRVREKAPPAKGAASEPEQTSDDGPPPGEKPFDPSDLDL